MVARDIQYTTKLYHVRSIQLELFDGGAPCTSQSDHKSEVFAPCEVIAPTCLPRMKKPNDFATERVARGCRSKLTVIAFLAGERQVLSFVTTSSGPWDYVFNRKTRW